MNDAEVRERAQSNPVSNLTREWGQITLATRRMVENLTTYLRELDKIQAQLKEHDLTVSVDLGPIGNAAAAARRDLERDNGRTFQLPR